MKIGILTFHRSNNYGAVLQAYALQNYLLEYGLDVEIIDYRPNPPKDQVRPNFLIKYQDTHITH